MKLPEWLRKLKDSMKSEGKDLEVEYEFLDISDANDLFKMAVMSHPMRERLLFGRWTNHVDSDIETMVTEIEDKPFKEFT